MSMARVMGVRAFAAEASPQRFAIYRYDPDKMNKPFFAGIPD